MKEELLKLWKAYCYQIDADSKRLDWGQEENRQRAVFDEINQTTIKNFMDYLNSL
jgi:hypothetical protein